MTKFPAELICRLFFVLRFRDFDFQHDRLALRDKRPLLAGQCGQQRQFHALHRGLDASQGMAAQRNLVRREDQTKLLRFPIALQFRKGELVERQQQALFSRYFDFDRASVRIARPTFGCFCAHRFQWVDDDDEKV